MGQTLLWALPHFLVLNLKRFVVTMRGRTRKVSRCFLLGLGCRV
jgi:hypothetical protein